MRIFSWVGAYLDSKCALGGEGMPFSVEKRLILLLAPLRYQVLIHKNTISLPEFYSIVKEQPLWNGISA
jgi:hypothetical protein